RGNRHSFVHLQSDREKSGALVGRFQTSYPVARSAPALFARKSKLNCRARTTAMRESHLETVNESDVFRYASRPHDPSSLALLSKGMSLRMNTEAIRQQMIDQQVRAGDVLDERVLDVMR